MGSNSLIDLEVSMEALQFFAPVSVRTEKIVQDIETVRDAAEFLRQWPQSRRGPVYDCAARACDAAIAGRWPGILRGNVGDHRLGGDQQSGDRAGVLKCG